MSDDLTARLRAAGCVFAEAEAEVLREAAAGDADRLERLARERMSGRPLEHVVGWADIAGVRVHVTPGVFVPRQRSTLLVELACAAAPAGGTLLDLCCGTGALGLAVAARRPDLTVTAADADADAVACARRNLPGREVWQGDLFAPLPDRLRGRVDVLLVNAPYVPTGELGDLPAEAREHERPIALDGGADGLDVHRRVAAQAPSWLTPGGVLLIEVADHQATAACDLLARAGLVPTVVADDERGATAVRAGVAGVGGVAPPDDTTQ